MKQASQKTRLLLATAFTFFFYFAQSVARQIFGTLQPILIEHFDLTLTESSWFSISENIGFILIMTLITIIADRIDKAWLMGGIGLIYSVILLFMGKGPSFVLFLALMFITGILGRYMDTTCTAYVSDLYGDKRNTYMSVMLILFYLGSTLAPNLNTLVLEGLKKPWNLSYTIAGLLMGVGTVLYFLYLIFIKKPALVFEKAEDEEKAPQKKATMLEILQRRNMLALFLSNVLTSFSGYMGMQLILYLSMTDPEVYDIATRGSIATAGSLGLAVGSALYILISRYMTAHRYLCMEIIVVAFASLAGMLINNPIAWMVIRFLSNAIGGGSFTARTLLCCEEMPEQSSSAIAVVSLASGITSIFATPLLNRLADATSLPFAMYLSLSFSVFTWAVLRFGYKPAKKSDEATVEEVVEETVTE